MSYVVNGIECVKDFNILGANKIVGNFTYTPISFYTLEDDISSILESVHTNLGLFEKEYHITKNINVDSIINIPKGAKIYIDKNCTATFTKIIAERYHIFYGEGNVFINDASYPEWFGAGNDKTDNEVYINKAINSSKKVLLNSDNYVISSPIKMKSYVSLIGENRNERYGNNTIITNTNNSRAIEISGTSANMIEECSIENICFISNYNNPSEYCIYMEYCANVKASHLRFIKYRNGLYANHTVYTEISNCCYDSSEINNTFDGVGFTLGGDDSHGNYNGNNASIRFNNNVAIMRSSANKDTGLLVKGYISDSFIDNFETVSGRYPIHIVGYTGDYFVRGQSNVWIRNCIIDAYSEDGIFIENCKYAGNINISDCYISPAFNATTFHNAIHLLNVEANTNINNNQLVNYDTKYSLFNRGIFIDGSSNIFCIGNQINNMPYPQTAVNRNTNLVFEDFIYNSFQSSAICCNLDGTVYFARCRNTINGGAKSIGSWCYNISNKCIKINIDNTNINVNCLSDSASFLNYKGTSGYKQIGQSADGDLYYTGFQY